MAREAITVGQTKDGKWVILAAPNIPIKKQRLIFGALKETGGDEGKYLRALQLFTPCKQYRFSKGGKLLIPVLDDLMHLAEDGLKAVIEAEKLAVKFSKDHEKTRELIRKAREKMAGDAPTILIELEEADKALAKANDALTKAEEPTQAEGYAALPDKKREKIGLAIAKAEAGKDEAAAVRDEAAAAFEAAGGTITDEGELIVPVKEDE